MSRVSYLSWKFRKYVSKEYSRVAYFGFFQPHVSDGIHLGVGGGTSSDLSHILLIQKKVVRTITKSNHHDYWTPLFKRLKYDKYSTQHNQYTRNKGKLDPTQHRLILTNKSFKYIPLYKTL